jgi:hypothetical protein
VTPLAQLDTLDALRSCGAALERECGQPLPNDSVEAGMKQISLVAMLAIPAIACTTSPTPAPGEGSAEAAQQLLPDGSTIEQACSPPEGPGHPYTTAAELSTLIAGTWVLCSGRSLSTTPNTVGMKFDTAAVFTQLVAGDGFVTVAPNDFEYGGTWQVLDDYPAVDVTLASLDSVWVESPAFEDQPRRFAQISEDANGDWVESVYVAVDD